MTILASLLVGLPANWFPFVIPWDDAVKGTATDVSFLNARPAGRNGRIVTRNGRFVEEKTGQRVRFLGTNLTARSAFPTHADADRIAARLAKGGFNIVRFHHLQNDWDFANGGSIWKKDKLYQELDPKQLDRMDYFVAALKRQGIYTNLNLTTTRRYLPAMGFPESVLEIEKLGGTFAFMKKIDKVNRRMIDLQKEYARQLLARKNPYTGLNYKDDPALAVVEINNENSLVGWPGQAPGAGLDRLPEPFKGEIVGRWNAWLRKRYPIDAALQTSWMQGITPDGPSLVTAANRWTHENQSEGDVTFKDAVATERDDRALPIAIDVRSNSGPDWHVQAHQTGLDLKEGQTYTVSFVASCSKPADITVNAGLDQPDWHNIGLSNTIRLTPERQTYRMTFVARDTRPNHSRVAFVLGAARGEVYLGEFQIRPGLGGNLLPEDASLAGGTIPLPSGGTANQMRDYSRFLTETETAFAAEMRTYLRKDLKIRSNLIDSQIQWGGLTALERERGSDFADAHMYWEHPTFPGGDWNPKNWTVRNTSMVEAISNGNRELFSLAENRIIGKPYSISEYNHPAPNDFRVEMMPVLASFAAAQDWDAIYAFDYGQTGTGESGNNLIQGFFQVATDPVKAAFFPTAALLFRGQIFHQAPEGVAIQVPKDRPWEPAFTAGQAWGETKRNPLMQRVGLLTGPVSKPTVRTLNGSKRVPPLSLRQGVWAIHTGRAAAWIGRLSGTEKSLQGVKVTAAPTSNRFAAISVVSVDQQPFQTSKRMLVTLANRAENAGMGWNADRTTVSDQWGTGPARAEGIAATLTIPAPSARTVWALDPNGRRKLKVPSTLRKGTLTFRADPKYRTLWYEVTAR